jgi:serine/threonine-protein kinase
MSWQGRILGSYRVLDKLGEGGMGAVYSAEHTLLGKRAAIKVLLPELSARPEIVQRFFNEARATTQIRHPNILDIYDYGSAEGSAFIVMELLDGESLATRLRREGRLSERLTVEIVRQVASALAAAHQTNIVHRDLKPDNVFLVPDGNVACGLRAKVLDFGIAKLAGDGSSMKTSTGVVMGTPAYMSPEQCRGTAGVDHRTDVYALGCMTYEMLSGGPPFRGAGMGDVLAAQIVEQPTPLGSRVVVAPVIDAAVMHALQKRVEDRTPTMAAFIGELDSSRPLSVPPSQFADTPPRTTLSGAVGERSMAPPRARPWGLFAVAAAVVVAAGALVAHQLMRPPPAVSAPPPAAPVPVAAPAPAAAPARIEVRINSAPPGADVFRIDGVRVGKTPFREQRERGAGELVYRVHLNGFADKQVEISLSADTTLDVALRKLSRQPPRQPVPDPYQRVEDKRTPPSGSELITPY